MTGDNAYLKIVWECGGRARERETTRSQTKKQTNKETHTLKMSGDDGDGHRGEKYTSAQCPLGLRDKTVVPQVSSEMKCR